MHKNAQKFNRFNVKLKLNKPKVFYLLKTNYLRIHTIHNERKAISF